MLGTPRCVVPSDNYQTNPHERITWERLIQRPLFLSVDSDGTTGYGDRDEYTAVIVDENLTNGTFEFDGTLRQTQTDWCEHTRRKRSWANRPNFRTLVETIL